MIAGLVSTHDHEEARRSIRILGGSGERAPEPPPRPGEPLAWLQGAGNSDARPAGAADPSLPRFVLDGHVRDLPPSGNDPRVHPSMPEARIASLWRDQGTALLDRIRGEFALAVWNPALRELVLATDPMGQRPLFYAQSADGTMLAFASRTSLLRRLDWVGSEPDDETVAASMTNLPVELGRTHFRAIRLVPGGHLARWREGRLAVERYWGPGFGRLDIRSVDDMLEAFEHAFRSAVMEQLDPARPIALLLSGGYDSTAVAGAIAAIRRDAPGSVPPVLAISSGFPGLACDETERIDIALADNGLPSRRFVPLGRGVSVESMQRDVRRHDLPIINFHAPFADEYASIAREFGAAVLMTGLGGDELTIDLDYQIDFVRAMGWLQFPRTVRRIATFEKRTPRSVANGLLRQLCPEPVKRPYRALRRLASPRARREPDPDRAWLEPAVQDYAARLGSRSPAPMGFDSNTKEVRWNLVANPILGISRRWFAVEAESIGLELASPLLDRRLFELAFAVDTRFHPRSWDRGEYKPLIARGLPYAPRKLVDAYWKANFQSYDVHVVQHSLGAIEELLFGSGAWHAGRYVSRQTAIRTLAAFRDAPERMLFRLGLIVGLEAWLRSLGDGAPKET